MELTVYSAAWCPDCREAKRFLAKHNIPYKDVDIETTPGAVAEVVKHTGKQAIPQFVIDGEWVQPYSPGQGISLRRNGQAPGNREALARNKAAACHPPRTFDIPCTSSSVPWKSAAGQGKMTTHVRTGNSAGTERGQR